MGIWCFGTDRIIGQAGSMSKLDSLLKPQTSNYPRIPLMGWKDTLPIPANSL